MVLTGGKPPVSMTFHPQNNKQAYLAYAAGLLTNPELLPAPRTNEEVLLLQLCLSGFGSSDPTYGGYGGVVYSSDYGGVVLYSPEVVYGEYEEV